MSHISFGIYKVEKLAKYCPDLYHSTRKGHYVIMFSGPSGAKHYINKKEILLPPYSLLFIGPDMISQFDEEISERTYVLVFSSEFFGRSNRDLHFLQTSPLFNDHSNVHFMTLPNENEALVYVQVSVSLLYQARDGFEQQLKKDLAHNLIEQVLIMGSLHYSLLPFGNYKEDQDNYLVVRYKELLAEHFHNEKSVQFYADKMNITERRLSKATEAVLGMGAKDLITVRIMEEAKRLLIYSEQDIKEISQTLGFSEQHNFSTFFMNNEKMRPTEYRKVNGL